jgi:hypothetical protein
MFGIILFLTLLFGMYFYNVYLREYFEVIRTYRALRKLLETRDLILLKLLPDVNNKNLSKKILNLIDQRRKKAKVSFDDGIIADAELNSALKTLYEKINNMKKNELQEEMFKHLIGLEKQLKSVRTRYSEAVTKYNYALAAHPKVLIKMLHLRTFQLYGNKN